MNTKQAIKAKIFLELHKKAKILVLPNAWDATSAQIFEQAGFSAIGTTSAGIANVLGYAEPEHIPRDEMLKAIARIVKAVTVPVTADIEAGYSSTPEGVAETIKMVIAAGAVGVNTEDTPGNEKEVVQSVENQVERIKAARAAASFPFVINARTDLYLFNLGDPNTRLKEIIHRGNAYLEAGADCIFVPGVSDSAIITSLVHEIRGPINILANAGVPAVSTLERLGVKRVSVGSGPMRATLSLIRHIAIELLTEGTYEAFTTDAISYAEANQFFKTND